MAIPSQACVVMGTAGHIDHGKTALVKALTGRNTDRLPEEQARKISIDIDFAPLRFEDGLVIGLVDVPGHERFVRNMLAGVAGIDAALLVIDANEGIKPQTREHLAILQLLGVNRLVVALTKADLVDSDWLAMAREVVVEWLETTPYAGAEIVATSVKTGVGIETLKQRLRDLALAVEHKDANGAFRLAVDKVFSIPGFGTVVSGTVARGQVEIGDMLDCVPARQSVRVRGIQVHGNPVSRALAGQRAALNLVGVDKRNVYRGHVLTTPGGVAETRLVDVHVTVLSSHEPGVRHREPVHVHLGTAEVMGRVLLLESNHLLPGEQGYAQLLLNQPVVCERGDSFVIRSFSPAATAGGGHIVDSTPIRLLRRRQPKILAALAELHRASPTQQLLWQASQGVPLSVDDAAKTLGVKVDEAKLLLDAAVTDGTLLRLPSGWLTADFVGRAVDDYGCALAEAHRKHRFQLQRPRRDVHIPQLDDFTSRDVDWLLQLGQHQGRWVAEAGRIRASDWEVALSAQEYALLTTMLSSLSLRGLDGREPQALAQAFPKRDRVALALLQYAEESGKIVLLSGGTVVTAAVFAAAVRSVRALFEAGGPFTVAQVRDALTISRKPAVALLETMDEQGLTRRIGDARHFVNRSAEFT